MAKVRIGIIYEKIESFRNIYLHVCLAVFGKVKRSERKVKIKKSPKRKAVLKKSIKLERLTPKSINHG